MPVPVEQTEPIKVANLSPMLLAKIRLMISDERNEIVGKDDGNEYFTITPPGSNTAVIALESERIGDSSIRFTLSVHNGTTGEIIVVCQENSNKSPHLRDLCLLMRRECISRGVEKRKKAQTAAEKYLDSFLSR